MAFSMSPPDSTSAFLQSIIPAPVFSRSSLTIAEVISTFFFFSSAISLFLGLLFSGRRLFSRRLAAQRGLALHDGARARLALGAHRALLAHAASPAIAASSAPPVTASAALGGRVAILGAL